MLGAGCASEPELGVDASESPAQSRRVLLIVNRQSPDSVALGRYYAARRRIPKANVVMVETTDSEEIARADFEKLLAKPALAAIKRLPYQIDFIVTTKGVPIRFSDYGGYSTDAHLAAMKLSFPAIERLEPEQLNRAINPYFGKREPFSSKKYGFYLVTRLDGYTLQSAKALADRSLAARPQKGPFLLDAAGNRQGGGYGDLQNALATTGQILSKKGYRAVVDKSDDFAGSKEPLAGYASWGSNDAKFDIAKYRGLRFKPGAIGETFVSTSARTFRKTTGGQSLVGDLIEGGITGVKGYVSEPYTFALARPEILFERYTSGYNLAESYYMASRVLKWKDVVIGDPLCAPYAKP